MASKSADDLERSLSAWRWVIIALHNATQGFMVLALQHGNGLLALSNRSYKEWFDAYENNKPCPTKEELDKFLNLYKKVKSNEYGTVGGNTRFVPAGTQGRSIKKLNEFRNEFIHFTPKGWSLEVDGLPQICLDSLALIEFLGWKTENIFWHEPNYRDQAKHCCKKLIEKMEYLDHVYSSIRS